MRGLVAAIILASVGCTSYQPAGLTGGFSDTRLSDTTYQVRFRGNGWTSPTRVQTLVLRRAAELALERGFRYFVIADHQTLDRRDLVAQYSERGVTVRLVESATPDAADAVVVIAETDDLAKGRLSEPAAAKLRELRGW